MQGCRSQLLHLRRTRYEMHATNLLRPAASSMICPFRAPFNCEDTAKSALTPQRALFCASGPKYSACVGQYLSFYMPSRQTPRAGVSSADWQGHETLVGRPHVVTVHVGWSVDVAQVECAVVGVEDERASVVGELIPGDRIAVVEKQIFGVGKLHRDRVVVGVA